jgi:peptidoglycan/LPS O-acetylase OafA/YrhL
MMSTSALRLLGKISYALYVFHVFIVPLVAKYFALGVFSRPSVVFSFMESLFGWTSSPGGQRTLMLVLDGVVYLLLTIGLSVGVALLSWYLLELPCLRLKRFFPYAGKATVRLAQAAQPWELSTPFKMRRIPFRQRTRMDRWGPV